MFTPEQYRAKADEYTALAKSAGSRDEREEFQTLQRSFTVMADNEQWLADNHDQTVHTASDSKPREVLAAEEEHVLRCLGAALIMQWNTIPTELQRELFDSAGSMGSLLDIRALRAQIARFLHKHKDDEADLAEALPAPRAGGHPSDDG
jgi:rubrerythrin